MSIFTLKPFVLISLIFLGISHGSLLGLQSKQGHPVQSDAVVARRSLVRRFRRRISASESLNLTEVVKKEKKNTKEIATLNRPRRFSFRASYASFLVLIGASSLIINICSPPITALFAVEMLSGAAKSIFLTHLMVPYFTEIYVTSVLKGKVADPKLNTIVQAIVEKSKIFIPVKVYVIPTTEQNAFAIGFFRSNFTKLDKNNKESSRKATGAALCLNKGLIDSLTTEELKGVIAHECGHIFHQDVRSGFLLLSVISGFRSVLQKGRDVLYDASTKESSIKWVDAAIMKTETDPDKKLIKELQTEVADETNRSLLLMTVGSISTFIASLFASSMRRQQERRADAHAKKLGYGAALITSLRKLEGKVSFLDKAVLSFLGVVTAIGVISGYYALTVGILFLSFFLLDYSIFIRLLRGQVHHSKELTPKKQGFLNWIESTGFSTHPPTKDRIEELGQGPSKEKKSKRRI